MPATGQKRLGSREKENKAHGRRSAGRLGLTLIALQRPERFCFVAGRLADAFAEGVAGYDEAKRTARCRQQDKSAWEAGRRKTKRTDGGLKGDYGLTLIALQRPKRFCFVAGRLADAFAEGVAGYDEAKRTARCRQQDKSAWEAGRRKTKRTDGGLKGD